MKSNCTLVLLFLVLVAGWGYCVAPVPRWGKFDTLRTEELRLGQSEAEGMLRCRVSDDAGRIQLSHGINEVELIAIPSLPGSKLLLKHTASSRTIEFATGGSSAALALLEDYVGRAQLAYRADAAFLMVGESDNSQIIVLREEKNNPHIAFVEKRNDVRLELSGKGLETEMRLFDPNRKCRAILSCQPFHASQKARDGDTTTTGIAVGQVAPPGNRIHLTMGVLPPAFIGFSTRLKPTFLFADGAFWVHVPKD